MSKTKTSSEGLDDRSIAIDSIILERLERAKRRFPRLCSLDSFRALNEEALESDAARKNGEDVNTKRVLRKAAVALMQIEITISIASLLRKVIKHVLIESIEMLEGDYGSHMSEREYELCACSIVFCAKLLPHCRDVVREFLRKMRKPLFERVNERRRRRVGVMGECRGRREMDGGDDDHEHARIVLRSSRYAQECFGCESGSGGASGVSWDWSACGAFMNHEDLHTRWIAIGLVCVALGLSDDAVHAARKRLCSTSAADEDDETAFLLADFQRDWDEHETAFRLERASFLLPTFIERTTSNNSSDQFDVTIEEEDDDDLENIPAAPGHERLGVIEVRAKQVLVEEIASPTLSMAQKEEKKKKKKSNNNSSDASDFVLVPSAERNLVAVAYALCQNRPVLLEGPAGCGKSATLREAARRFGRSSEDNDVIVLHFDAHTDSKSLLGAYVCGASPGEFEWQPGSLTRAVKSGKWVLIEDVDVAPFEVLSALIPLLEERKLYIAGRGEIVVAHPQFQLFGSATIGGSKVSNRENDPLGGLWTRVSVEQPSGDEPGKILSELYPQLSDADVRGRMLKTMRVAQTMVGQGGGHASRLAGLGDEHFDNAVSDDNNNDNDDDEHNNNNNMMMMMDTESNNPENENRGANNNGGKMTSLEDLASNEAASQARATVGRPFTLRDLLRWAKRATSLRKADLKLIKKGKVTPPQARQAMYDEAADVLLGALPPGTGRRRALQAVAEIWGLHPEETANTTDLLRKPDVLSSEDSVRVGRTMLPCEERDDELENFRNFAKTGHALRMLERVSCAVSVNEPALLVGETGTGKTALVQELARLTGAPLTVVNLSNQSESSDFLGGFRPAGARHLCLPLLKKFLELFGETFPSRSNADFLGRVSKFAEKRKWVHLLKAFRAGVDRVASVVDKDDKMEADDDATDKMNDTIDAEVAPTEDVTTTRRATRSQVTGKKGEDENSVSPNSNDSNKRQKTSAVTKKTTTKNSAAVTTKPTFKISDDLVEIWQSFDRDLVIAERAIGDVASSTSGGPIFAFVEGALVTALREGHWILLDEINLAPAETLERLNGVLESRKGSIVLSERGDATPVYRHPRFRLFAAMNPATDVGKRDLPPALKHRFAEVYCGETESREDLQLLVRGYLRDVPSGVIAPIVDFYVEAKRAAHSILLDSADQKPRYSLRTLARALEYVSAASPLYGVQRAMMDGFSMSFLTLLKKEGQVVLEKLMHKHLLGGKAIKGIMKPPPAPQNDTHVLLEQFWVEAGDLERIDPEGYVVTESVRSHLSNLSRAVLLRRHPILLQGPTSAGKTSLIEYLAKRTGHRFMRINNHEHTDLQEYLGTYITDETGALTFQEGALVQAVRRGYWVVLDELNLAPSDVLEALNRLLDDNRELFVPELQETIRPHPHFVLFATQNPPGAIYGGRKVLSKAFRNRFVELHIGDIPDEELKVILNKRCEIAPSYCVKLVESMRELQGLRRGSRAFAGKDGYITARDLFRWANRKSVGYENLASDGFRVLGERLRSENERLALRKVLEKALKVPEISVEQLYESASSENLEGRLESALTIEGCKIPADEIEMARSIAWTPAMRRLYALVEACVEHKEPALLVGETGCGKTTVVQILAMIHGQKLRVLNCHQHTETGDFIGGFRPARQGDAPFAWEDGPLIKAMRNGDILLVDELSLAEDSVLERLNSVLEPGRTITLPEKGGKDVEELVAHPNFRLIGTMNPGGDFGKKELSPALRNRFTEIWVGSVSSAKEMEEIVARRLVTTTVNIAGENAHNHAKELALFWEFYQSIAGAGQAKACLQTRDILAWAQFINEVESREKANAMLGFAAFAHGAYLTLLDGLGLGLGMPEETARALNRKCVDYLRARIPDSKNRALEEQILNRASYTHGPNAENENEDLLNCSTFADGARFGISSFSISCGTNPIPSTSEFALTAPSTRRNVARLLRALQLARKPILLEGSPGVGKTSIVSALAKAAGHKLVRLNLSEQTDMMDLLGADLPASGGEAGEFKWSDGAFLAALKNGDWVLLDELNLAPQPVLEGLNAALDHRAEVFVPELGKTFKCPPTFRVFAAQNPAAQGGGRKGLPKSFLNRFTRVFVEPMRINDVEHIAKSLHPNVIESVINKMVQCNAELARLSSMTDASGYRFARAGAPWEFNLRDIMRWCELVTSIVPAGEINEHSYVRECASVFNALYTQRLRTVSDRNIAKEAFARAFGVPADNIPTASHIKMRQDGHLEIGNAILHRNKSKSPAATSESGVRISEEENLAILRGNLDSLEAATFCIARGWMTIVVGQAASGKTTLIKTLARLSGKDLQRIALTSATDTSELLGSFEQKESSRDRVDFESRLFCLIQKVCESNAFGFSGSIVDAWKLWEMYKTSTKSTETMSEVDAENAVRLLSDVVAAVTRAATAALQSSSSSLPSNTDDVHIQTDMSWLKDNFEAIITPTSFNVGPKKDAGRFEWVDGALLKAVERGDWVLLENANLCSPTVLDRLNPLLEPEGTLLVNECGFLPNGESRIVKAHEGFRLFLAVDPKRGEVSRAMRNRGVEVFLHPKRYESPYSLDGNNHHQSLFAKKFGFAEMPGEMPSVNEDIKSMILAKGIPNGILADTIVQSHFAMVIKLKSGGNHAQLTSRDSCRWAELALELVNRGVPVMRAFRMSLPHAYNVSTEEANFVFDKIFVPQMYSVYSGNDNNKNNNNVRSFMSHPVGFPNRVASANRISREDRLAVTSLEQFPGFSLSIHLSMLLSAQKFVQHEIQIKSKNTFLKLQQNQALLSNLSTEQLMQYFKGAKLGTLIGKDVEWCEKLNLLFRASTIYALKKSAESVSKSERSWAYLVKSTTSACQVPEIACSISAWAIFRRFFEEGEFAMQHQILLSPSCARYAFEKAYVDAIFLNQTVNGDMKALAMSHYRARNKKESARQSAVHPSLDRIYDAYELLGETNEIYLRETLACSFSPDGDAIKLLGDFMSWRSHFIAMICSTSFEHFEVSSDHLDAALENVAVAWLQAKRAAEKYESWLSEQSKTIPSGHNSNGRGFRNQKRSLLVDEAFGVPSKPPGTPLLWQAIGKPTLPQNDDLRFAEEVVRVAAIALRNNGSSVQLFQDFGRSSGDDPASRAISFLAKEAANLGASAKLRFAALEALCFFSFTHVGIASTTGNVSDNDAVVLPSLLSRQFYQHCVETGAWDAATQRRAKSMLNVHEGGEEEKDNNNNNNNNEDMMLYDDDDGDAKINVDSFPFAFEIPNRDLIKSLDDNDSWLLETTSSVLSPPKFSFPPWALKWKEITFKNSQLSPFAELRSLELDREVLTLLSSILSLDSSESKEDDDRLRRGLLFERLNEATSKALSFGISHSPRAVSDFEGHRKLLWDINAASATSFSAVESSVIARRALEIFLSWHDAHRLGALSSLPQLLKSTKKSSNAGTKNDQITSELESKWISCDGPARTERALQTILTSALFVSTVGLEERGQRVAQLRLAARQLRMSRNSDEDSSRKDWDTLRGIFIHTMWAYGANGKVCEYALGLREDFTASDEMTTTTRQSLFDKQREIVNENLKKQFTYTSSSINETLEGLFSCLSEYYISSVESTSRRANRDRFLRGMAWARLGCLRLHCMFPSGMSDPMAETANDARRVNREIQNENAPAIEVIEFHERSPLLASGSNDDPEKQIIMDSKKELEKYQIKLQRMFAPRPNVPKWRQLMRHVSRFSHEKGGLAEPARLEATLKSLEVSLKVSTSEVQINVTTNHTVEFEKACQEARLLADAAKQWSEALETSQFSGYSDATKPLRLAAAELSRGLKLLEDGLSGGTVDPSRALVTRAMRELFKFPQDSSVRDRTKLNKDDSRATSSLLTDVSTLKALQKLEKSGELRVAVLKVAMQKVRDEVIKEKSLSPQLWKSASSVFDRLAELWKSVRDIEMQKDETIYEHDDKIAVFRRVTAAPSAVEIMEGDDDETEKRFSETTFGKFNDQWKEFANAPGDILQLDHDCVEDGDHIKKEGDEDSDDEVDQSMDRKAAIAAKMAGLLEGVLLLELVATHEVVCAIGASTSVSANPETSYDTERNAINPSKFLRTNAKELTESLANRATAFVEAHNVGCMILRRAAIADDRFQALPRVLDDTSQLGNLTRISLEHLAVSRGTMSEDAGIETASKDEAFNHKKLQRHADAIDHEMSRGDAPGETSLALTVISNTRRKITRLLDEWPEHPLLTQLAEICDRILNLPLLGPVKTFLTGLELLLARAQTWEQSASSETSLIDELTAIANVAMRWRRRELHAWSRLLERCSERHSARARRTWFALHRLLKSVQSSSSFDAVDDESMNTFENVDDEINDEGDIQGIREITRALEEYLQGSTLGEFLARLSLVKTFEFHLTADIRARASLNLPPRLGDNALRCVLHNTYRYYYQFKSIVEGEIEKERATPARKLEDHAKLAKWENRGYHFMKQQAESNERVLHKHVRTFDRALQKLILPILEAASRNGTGLGVLPQEQSEDEIEATLAPTNEEPLEVIFEEIADEDEEKKKKRFDKAVKTATLKREREKREEIAAKRLKELDIDLKEKKRMFGQTANHLLARVSPLKFEVNDASKSPLLYRADELTKKIANVLSSSMMETSRRTQIRAGSVDIDAFASRIARRATALRNDKNAKKAIKKKALNDLMKTLPEIGVTHKRSAVPEKFREPARWFTEPPLEQLTIGQKQRFLEIDEFDSADRSYYIVMSRVQRLQNITNNNPPNPDLEVRQTTRAVAMCEHLLHRLRAQRKTLSSALSSESILDEFASSLERLVDEAERAVSEPPSSIYASENLSDWICDVRAFIEDVSDAAKDAILASVASSSCESISKLRGAWNDKTAREALQNVETRCEEAREALKPYVKLSFAQNINFPNNRSEGKEMYASWRAAPMLGSNAKSAISLALDRLSVASEDVNTARIQVTEAARSKDVIDTYGTYAMDCENCPGWDPLHQLLGEKLSNAISRFERSYDADMSSTHSSSSDDVDEAMESFNKSLEVCIERALIWSQGVRSAAMTEEEEKKVNTDDNVVVDGDDDEKIVESFNTYEKHCGNAVGAKRLETICEAVFEASLAFARITQITAASATKRNFASSAIVNAAKLAPMFRLIALTSKETITEYVKFHRSSTKLAKVLTAIFAGLCEEGFCGAKDDGDGRGSGDGENMKLSDDKDGTGAAEGEGKKDVSNEIENEEQILGLEDAEKNEEEKKESKGDQGEEEEEDRGIEMKSDFEGVTHDVENEPEDGNEDEELEKEMGEHEDGNDIIDERLWNDEDDKKEKEEGKDEGPDEFEKGDAMKKEDARDEEMRGKDDDDDNEKDDGGKKPPPSDSSKEKGKPEKDEKPPSDDEDKEAEDTKDEDKKNDQEVKDSTGITPKGEDLEDDNEGDLDLDVDENMEPDAGGEDEANDINQPEGEDEASKPTDGNDGDDLTGENGENGNDRDDTDDTEMNPDEPPAENEKEVDEDGMDVDNEEGDNDEDDEDGQIDQDGKDNAVNNDNAMEAHEEEDKDARNQAGPKGAGDGGGGDDVDIDENDAEQQQGQGGEQGAASARGTAGDGSAKTQPKSRSYEEEENDADKISKEQKVTPEKPMPKRSAASNMKLNNDDDDDAGDGDGDGEAAGEGAAVPTTNHLAIGEEQEASQKPNESKKNAGGPEMNPHRSLAAAMKQWRDNLSIVGDDADEEGNVDNNGGGGDENDGATEFEFIHGEDNDDKGPSALAPATEEQALAQKLRGNKGDDDDKDNEDKQNALMEEEEINAEEFFNSKDKKVDEEDLAAERKENDGLLGEKEEDSTGKLGEKQKNKKSKKNNRDKIFAPDDELNKNDQDNHMNEDDIDDDEDDDDDEGEMVAFEDEEAKRLRELEQKRLDEAIVELKNANIDHQEIPLIRELTEEEIEIARTEAEKDLQAFREDKDNLGGEMDEEAAQHLWRTLEDLTGALSGELSEQLRLILEPTLASRLRGDYRTGKRLNMRKIIPYIASDFRKDKIWLRRSKPSERRYQVVLAVDDSLSMSENKRGRAALEAMVLLARAMSRLEVGDIGIVGFGGSVKTLHPLGEPFADQNGPNLVSKLTFQQDSTLADRPMVTLLETLHSQLSLSRENSRSVGADGGGLHQLVLIIADGQFHEKEALAKVMREFGNQKGVLIAFIILDNPEKSLLDMQSVSFEGGKPKLSKYLDSFPFPYYVLVQESNQLPSTISDLLRQWIEMVSSNSD